MWDCVNLKWDVAGKENTYSVGFLWISKGYKRHWPMGAVARKVGLCQVSTRHWWNRGLLDQLLERLVSPNKQIGLLYIHLSLTPCISGIYSSLGKVILVSKPSHFEGNSDSLSNFSSHNLLTTLQPCSRTYLSTQVPPHNGIPAWCNLLWVLLKRYLKSENHCHTPFHLKCLPDAIM